MKSYAIFRVTGINNIGITGADTSFTLEDRNIKTIKLNIKDNKINGIKTEFSVGIEISNELIASTEEQLKIFLIQLILQKGALARGLSIELDKVYDEKSVYNVKNYIEARSDMKFSDSLQCAYSYDIEEYKNSYLSIPEDDSLRDDYFIQFNILRIDNIAIRYLLQYEFLLSRISKKRKQKDVTDYIINKYNSTKPFNIIGTRPTRRPGKTFEEDEITYYRNILAHNEGRSLKDIEEKINLMSRAMNEVIWYYLSVGC